MMNKLLIDSDVIIELTRGSRYANTLLTNYKQQYTLCISTITRYEVLIGSKNKQEMQWLLQLLQAFETLYLDEKISQKAEKLLILYNLSHNLQLADAIIGATAITYQIPFLSRNQKDFRYISTLNLLPY